MREDTRQGRRIVHMMEHEDERMRGSKACPERLQQGWRQKRSAARASMRHEFMELFRDTRLPPPEDATTDEDAPQAPERSLEARTVPTAAATEPSRFLRRFLQHAAPSPEPARSGLAVLDDHLGGGFDSGLHLIVGPPGSGKTAFLESLAWEAVGDRRPSLYYALKPGSLEVWERLIATLGSILEGPGITPAALRGRDLPPEDVETLARLDAALQASVLPYLSLVDAAPGSVGKLSAFVEGVRSHCQEITEQHGRLPLVLVDDLDRLIVLTRTRSPVQVLSRLDAALAADSMPGLLAVGSEGVFSTVVDRLPVRTIVALTAVTAGPSGRNGRVDLEVRKNSATGWTGTVPLLLDPSSGLFAEAAPAD
jgi:DnaB-like helicase C terminal domain